MSTVASIRRRSGDRWTLVIAAIVALGGGLAMPGLADQGAATVPSKTASPIQHVIIVVGENAALITSTPLIFRRAAKPC